MGLIQAALASAGGVLGDQWKEFFYCDSLSADILVSKGHRRKNSSWSSNDGDDNIITNGSRISVNNGQCAIIVQQGKVIDLCADSGEYIYDKAKEASIFDSGKTLAENIQEVFFAMKGRFEFGGDSGIDERIYYFNTKEIVGNKYGTPTPIPFRVVDYNIGLDVDISIKCFGSYSYKIVNPILFYTNVCGNVRDVYNRSEIDAQLKTELMTALQPAFAKISEMGIRYSALPAHTQEIADALNEVLSKKWGEKRGLEIVSFGVSNVSANEEDVAMIKEMQRSGALRNPAMAAAVLTSAQANAMQDAANNSGGAAIGFMNMNMAANAGGVNAGNLYAMAQQQQQQAQQQQQQNQANRWKCTACGNDGNRGKFCANCGAPKPVANEWTCECGAVNKGKFCAECGKPKPVSNEWTCECGHVNKGKFCAECGKPRP
ncbi:MAG: SPFH domain-containing protein [Selenomonadaceae bacterium]|nr:SPFH domain-containing protein [Selenomonadaceae bacterium]